MPYQDAAIILLALAALPVALLYIRTRGRRKKKKAGPPVRPPTPTNQTAGVAATWAPPAIATRAPSPIAPTVVVPPSPSWGAPASPAVSPAAAPSPSWGAPAGPPPPPPPPPPAPGAPAGPAPTWGS